MSIKTRTFSTKKEAFAYKYEAEKHGAIVKGVFKVEQNITQASRGDYASQIGGNEVTKSVSFRVEIQS